jgi:methyl-accepting chemotaxis protein
MQTPIQTSTQTDEKTLTGYADPLTVASLFLGALIALAIGAEYNQLSTAVIVGGLLCGTGLLAWRMAPGTLLSRMVLAGCLMSMVALHIQLGRGTLEFHFGVFVVLGLLLVYLDWRPLVLAAALIAVHHLLFDRLQASGVGVYCRPEASFLMVMITPVTSSCKPVWRCTWL